MGGRSKIEKANKLIQKMRKENFHRWLVIEYLAVRKCQEGVPYRAKKMNFFLRDVL